MVVPCPGWEAMSRVPPAASTRSVMWVSPSPETVWSGSNPVPSSVTVTVKVASLPSSSTWACCAFAWTAAFFKASTAQKYAVASTSRG
jgi:hypothetical protein